MPSVARKSRIEPAALPCDLDGIVHVLTCGSVDDGKSTLIGRLLWDAGDLPDDTRATLAASAGADGKPDLSLLVDGLSAEREQGITIDIAWRYFDAGHRRFVIVDSPGHEQYTRNMASGASHADIAIMLVDSRHGVKRQTRRHAAILDLFGVKRLILAVNKMDLVDWSQARFREIESEFRAVTRRFDFKVAVAIPIAAKPGDNVVLRSTRMAWYDGRTLFEQLEEVPSRGHTSNGAFRMPVQCVLRGEQDFRGLAGTISSGSITVGSTVADSASGRFARVRRIVTMERDLEVAATGQAITLQLDTDIDVARGAVLSAPDAAPMAARHIETRLVWLADTPLDIDHGLLLRTATDLIPIAAISIRARLDLETLAQTTGAICSANDVVLADIELGRPATLDRFAEHRETGSFVLVDALTGTTLAGGIVKAVHASGDDRRPAGFTLTARMLSQGVCAGLVPGSTEFRRRAEEVAIILKAAGVTVENEQMGLGSN